LDEVGIQVPFPHRLLLIRNADGGPDEGAIAAFARLPVEREGELGLGAHGAANPANSGNQSPKA
jgi:hypothetical protein